MRNINQTAENTAKLLNFLGDISAESGERLASCVMKNLGRSLETAARIDCAIVSNSHKPVLSTTPDVVIFYHTGGGLYLGKIV